MARKKQPKGLNEPIIGYKSPQRYQICGDNSGHEYFIPAEQVDEFYEWAEAGDAEESYIDFGKYDGNRIDGTFTFTDPQCN